MVGIVVLDVSLGHRETLVERVEIAFFSLCPDSLGKNPSTAFIRDAGVGVKRSVRSGRCRRWARDLERSLESSLTRAQHAAGRFLMCRVAREPRA